MPIVNYDYFSGEVIENDEDDDNQEAEIPNVSCLIFSRF